MCGICGAVAVNRLDDVDMSIFIDLMTISVFRGKDAAGIAYCLQEKNKAKYFFDKDVTPSPIYIHLKSKHLMNLVKAHKVKSIIGHARWATVGERKKENAHPFNTPKLLGVHNGTVQKYLLDKADSYETDSEALLNMIDEKGLHATIDGIREKGAYALNYFEKAERNLVFYRNVDRPLHFAYDKAETVLFWASEAEALEFVLARYNIAMKEVWQLKVHTLFRIPMLSKKPFHNALIEEFKFKEEPPVWGFHRRWNYKENKWEDVRSGTSGVQELVGNRINEDEKDKVLKYRTWRDLDKFNDELPWKPITPKTLVEQKHGPSSDRRFWSTDWIWNREKEEFIHRDAEIAKLLEKGEHFERRENDTFFMIGKRGYTRADYEEILANGCGFCTVHAAVEDPVRHLNTTGSYLCKDCKDDPEILKFLAVN